MQNEEKQQNTAVVIEPESKQTPQEAPQANWQYSGAPQTTGQANDPVAQESPQVGEITWTASEFIAHDKNKMWYVFTGGAVIAIAAVVFLLDSSHGWFSPLMILMAGGIFAFYANRKPQILDYSVDSDGVHVGQKLYRYGDFKSFAVIQEGAINSIMLIPLQRFMPGLSIYYEPKDEQSIVDAIGTYLPHEERQQDVIDRLMRKIRF